MNDRRPLVLHLVYSFDVGGLENGIVNLINRMDPDRFRHTVVALTRCEPSFCERVKRRDVRLPVPAQTSRPRVQALSRVIPVVQGLAPRNPAYPQSGRA